MTQIRLIKIGELLYVSKVILIFICKQEFIIIKSITRLYTFSFITNCYSWYNCNEYTSLKITIFKILF